MPGPLRTLILLAAATGALAGCGSDGGTIPQEDSDALIARLNAVESSVEDRNCDVARQQADAFSQLVDDLPTRVDPEVREGLEQAAAQLVELASDPNECNEGASGVTGVEPATTTPTIPETTTAAPTTTATEETTTKETTTATEPESTQDTTLTPPTGDTGEGDGAPGGGPPNDGGVGPTGGIGGGGGQ